MRFLFLCLLLFTFSLTQAQNLGHDVFKGKTVAVYFSKKYFTFPEDYRFMVPAFILSDQGKDTPLEDLRQQTLISLGRMFAEQLASVTGADSAWFLNEDPAKASQFMQRYDADSSTLEPMPARLPGADLILVINPLTLGGYKRNIVYVRSDRVITEKEYEKTAKARFILFDPASGRPVASTHICFDSFNDKVDQPRFDFRSASSPLGKFLSQLFTLGILQLQGGIPTTCE